MNELNYPESTKYVVAHNNDDFFVIFKVTSDQCFKTGQPFMEIFNSEEDARVKFPKAL